MAHVKKLRYADYWSTDCLMATESLRKIMPRDRHRDILNFLYFYDSNVANTRDPLYKIRPIIDELQRSFSRCFYPFRNLCIDESLMLFKGWLSFKQFIPAKRNRFGIKSFVLCDCLTGYILNFIVYTGKTTDSNGQSNDDLGKSGSVVMTLLEPYLEQGHTVFVDNWYASPALFTKLQHHKTNACGTVKKTVKICP